MNIVVLRGCLSRPPALRELPSGATLTAFEVTVRREEGPAESVPVTWLDAPERVRDLSAGTEVVVSGRVVRRFFRAGGATASRTEVVATAVVPARQRARCRTLLSSAHAQLGEAVA